MGTEEERVNSAIDLLKSQALIFGYEGIRNAAIRERYIRDIKNMSDDMLDMMVNTLAKIDLPSLPTWVKLKR